MEQQKINNVITIWETFHSYNYGMQEKDDSGIGKVVHLKMKTVEERGVAKNMLLFKTRDRHVDADFDRKLPINRKN